MWRLQAIELGTGPIFLLAGKEYVVGRKNCEILLSNDQSISRVHAHVSVSEQAVTLKDSSKYGTFVNNKRLETGSTKTVYAGDNLTFGVFQSKFRLELDSVVVCSSCVDDEGKATLSKDVQALGGRLVNAWSQECTHLVMPAVKVTIKTICALLCCRPIVKSEFFTELSRAVQQRKNLPKAQRPEIDEISLAKEKVDLGPRPERKTLFAGKTFVFLNTKQMKRLSQAVSFGGGRSQLLEEGSLPVSLLESTGTCVVDVTMGSSQTLIPSTTKNRAMSVGLILHRNGLRFIAESEIGLAAIYVNNQTYCNPCSSLDSKSVKMTPSISEATLSPNAAVDETVLHGASLNITAYVVNTEPSQSISRRDECGATAVGETPEKRSTNPLGATTFKKPPVAMELPAACSEPRSIISCVKEKKMANSESQRSDECNKFTEPLNNSATITKSLQKQVSLTSYFKPSNKKRLREGSTDSELSETKISRQEDQESISNLAPSLQKSSATRLDSKMAQKQQDATPCCGFSGSLRLGSGLATDSRSGGLQQNPGLNLDSNYSSKKRKEPEQDPVAPADLDVSLEELESIMSEDMDEPQPTASKKLCLDKPERSTAIAVEDCKTTLRNQRREEKPQRIGSTSRNLEQDRQSVDNRNTERTSQISEREQHGLTLGNDGFETVDAKGKEVSFLLETMRQIGFIERSKVDAVKEEKHPEKDAELPRKLMQVQFMSLTVKAPRRTRTEPLQVLNTNGKNFKRFRKVPVPGLHGLPKIIGGSDLAPYNRSKNSELEEWLRDAAEQKKQQERDESLSDDLFRYNPRTTKRSSKKRKEPEQDPVAPADLDVSLEELESIMSEDMDKPQPTASKKLSLDKPERSTAIAVEDCKNTLRNQRREEKPQRIGSTSRNLEQDRQSVDNRNTERTSQISEREQHGLTLGNDGFETVDAKGKEVSFLLETMSQIGFIELSKVDAVKEEKHPEKDAELPRKLMQVQFMSLTVKAPRRTRTEPLQVLNTNGKNFKRFRKVPVPGLRGLPKIIGGSDLAPYNRSKNSELEEWLRDAAEQKKQQEREESLSDDLFRHNPRTTERR